VTDSPEIEFQAAIDGRDNETIICHTRYPDGMTLETAYQPRLGAASLVFSGHWAPQSDYKVAECVPLSDDDIDENFERYHTQIAVVRSTGTDPADLADALSMESLPSQSPDHVRQQLRRAEHQLKATMNHLPGFFATIPADISDKMDAMAEQLLSFAIDFIGSTMVALSADIFTAAELHRLVDVAIAHDAGDAGTGEEANGDLI